MIVGILIVGIMIVGILTVGILKPSHIVHIPVTVPIFSTIEGIGEVAISSSVAVKEMATVLRCCLCCASGLGRTPDIEHSFQYLSGVVENKMGSHFRV